MFDCLLLFYDCSLESLLSAYWGNTTSTKDIINPLLTTLAAIASAIAATTSAYVAYKNRKELNNYRLSEKKEQQRKELSDKYKLIILDRKLDAVDTFYNDCCNSLNKLKSFESKGFSSLLFLKMFSASYSSHTHKFSKNFTVFVKAIDKELGDAVEKIILDYQDKIMDTLDCTFPSEIDNNKQTKYDVEKITDNISKLLDNQHAELIQLIISYIPKS